MENPSTLIYQSNNKWKFRVDFPDGWKFVSPMSYNSKGDAKCEANAIIKRFEISELIKKACCHGGV